MSDTRRVVVVLLVLTACVPCHAATLVSVDILQDGKQIAGITRTDMGEDHATLWQYLKTDRLSVERDFVIPVSDDDPLKAVLNGNLEMRLVYRNSETVASTKVNQLTLVRKSTDSDEWFVDPADVDRSMKAAGLTLVPPAATPMQFFLLAIILISFVLLLLAIVFFLQQRSSLVAK